MATNLILSKQSSESEIKSYFNSILKLSKSDNQFPINLDDVWMLVYSERGKAVRVLKENFIENVDYILLAQNGKQVEASKWGGNNKIDYLISLPCMEFFIARKVRDVFEVYRKVFHGAVNQLTHQRKPTITPTKIKASIEWIKGVSEILNLSDSSKHLLLEKIAKPLELPLPAYTKSKGIVKSASELLKGSNMTIRQFNQKMIEKGFLTELERKATVGYKTFKSLTIKGLDYGENMVNPHNPTSTQPVYYEEKFNQLLTLLS